tara:strand:- start:771 stop:1730 length:960 start_codon:yes stop_codon:yes gene_type:complete
MIYSIDNKYINKIKFNLDKIAKKNIISNAYIFYGPENIGKKEVALRFIAEIIKTNNSDLQAYSKIKENNYPDFLKIEPTYLLKGNIVNKSEIDKENDQKTGPIIRIEQIRNIKNFLGKKSIQSSKKFILIENAHLLNESSSNCLLKTLEEPTNGVFILLTSRLNLLLDTIISRCQPIRFKPYSDQELKQLFEQTKYNDEDISQNNEVIENLIFISNGSPGKLLDNLEIWNQIPEKIKNDINIPLKSFENILLLAKNISSNLNLDHQKLLLDYMQRNWWVKTKDKRIVDVLETIKNNISTNIQPRTSWEVGLLKIKLDKS